MVGMIDMPISDSSWEDLIPELEDGWEQWKAMGIGAALGIASSIYGDAGTGSGNGSNSSDITVEAEAGVKNASLKLDENGSLVLVIDDTNEGHVFLKTIIQDLQTTEEGGKLLTDITSLMNSRQVDEINLYVNNEPTTKDNKKIWGRFESDLAEYGKSLDKSTMNLPINQSESGAVFDLYLNKTQIDDGSSRTAMYANYVRIMGHELGHFRQVLTNPLAFHKAGFNKGDWFAHETTRTRMLHAGETITYDSINVTFCNIYTMQSNIYREIRNRIGPNPY